MLSDANPPRGVSNAKRLWGIALRGEWFSVAALNMCGRTHGDVPSRAHRETAPRPPSGTRCRP
jgi:hypothetical protein